MRKRFCLLPALALALLCACSKGAAKTPPTRPADFTSTERQFNTPADGDTIAIFDTSLGEVRAVLYPDAAPMAVYNFVGLARSGYYDNTTIWRSEYGFAVQGGDATGTGTGGSTIWSNNPYPPEASADLKHYAGSEQNFYRRIRQHRTILSADTASEARQMLSKKRRQYFVYYRAFLRRR